MDKKVINKLLVISSLCFSISGIIFLCISIFREPKDTTYLCIALANIVLGNLFNVIKIQQNKK